MAAAVIKIAGNASDRPGAPLIRFAWLAVATALATMALKTVAWLLTGSVGLLSDALESIVNLAAALFAVFVLWWAAKPADEEHAYGHAKAEYLSVGVEGTLIFLAALSIAWAAIGRLINPSGLEDLGVGMSVASAAAALNLAVGLVLVRSGRRFKSCLPDVDPRGRPAAETSDGVCGSGASSDRPCVPATVSNRPRRRAQDRGGGTEPDLAECVTGNAILEASDGADHLDGAGTFPGARAAAGPSPDSRGDRLRRRCGQLGN
ncbi:MAG TPA: cation diffusion facilitator family transporter [Solirubrobacterales bacterium]|nr:cation diffusion facilitator family transporter [Solirubrobacterales bacterium]